MNFGNWEESTHENSEQLKRIASAKKSETTPSNVDFENATASFKGSGKNPYVTTLNSCTCGDFLRRKLPCKHIYRLAFELDGSKVEYGVNKNERNLSGIPYNIFALPVETQELLYDMCVDSIYHNVEYFVFQRNNFSELLFHEGIAIENIPDTQILNALRVAQIKEILFSSDIPNLPKRTSQKKTLIMWFEENSQLAIPLIQEKYIFLELSQDANLCKHKIHRRYAKKFIHEEGLDDFGFNSQNTIKIFSQE